MLRIPLFLTENCRRLHRTSVALRHCAKHRLRSHQEDHHYNGQYEKHCPRLRERDIPLSSHADVTCAAGLCTHSKIYSTQELGRLVIVLMRALYVHVAPEIRFKMDSGLFRVEFKGSVCGTLPKQDLNVQYEHFEKESAPSQVTASMN
jgi:hypothetical protein